MPVLHLSACRSQVFEKEEVMCCRDLSSAFVLLQGIKHQYVYHYCMSKTINIKLRILYIAYSARVFCLFVVVPLFLCVV